MQKDVSVYFLEKSWVLLPMCWNSFLYLQHPAEHVPEVKDQGLLNQRLHSLHASLSKEQLKKTSLVQGSTWVTQACSCCWPQAVPGEELPGSQYQILKWGSCCSLCQCWGAGQPVSHLLSDFNEPNRFSLSHSRQAPGTVPEPPIPHTPPQKPLSGD